MTFMTDTAIAAHVRTFLERGGDVATIAEVLEEHRGPADCDASLYAFSDEHLARLWKAGVTQDEVAQFHGTDDNAWMSADDAVEIIVDIYDKAAWA